MNGDKYATINGLKGVSILLIVLMHVALNGNYQIDGFFFDVIISNTGIFIELFLIISGFGMCCGYYNKIKENKINLNEFYSRRYSKIIPFLGMVVVADVIFSGISKHNILDGLLDLTLLHGFLPNSHIEIIGVAWTLGVIFAFYCLFPFFVFLLWNKNRAWFVLILSLIIRFGCSEYFKADGEVVMCNITTWFYYFMIGGLLFLYKDTIKEHLSKYSYIVAITIGGLFVAEIVSYKHFHSGVIPANLVRVMFVVMVIYCICTEKSLLCTKPVQFIGDNCLEIYLAHMMMYRVLEKINVLHLFDNEIVSFVCVYICVVVMNLVFSVMFKMAYSKIMEFWKGSKKIHGRNNA